MFHSELFYRVVLYFGLPAYEFIDVKVWSNLLVLCCCCKKRSSNCNVENMHDPCSHNVSKCNLFTRRITRNLLILNTSYHIHLRTFPQRRKKVELSIRHPERKLREITNTMERKFERNSICKIKKNAKI